MVPEIWTASQAIVGWVEHCETQHLCVFLGNLDIYSGLIISMCSHPKRDYLGTSFLLGFIAFNPTYLGEQGYLHGGNNFLRGKKGRSLFQQRLGQLSYF